MSIGIKDPSDPKYCPHAVERGWCAVCDAPAETEAARALRESIAEVKEHNSDYHHVTDAAKIETWKRALGGKDKKMIFIGDVHGKIAQFLEILEKYKDQDVLQIGDMGLGFQGVHLPELAPNHKFIRGNHDDPAACKAHPSYAGEFGVWVNKVFFLGGAWSIDHAWRRDHNKQMELLQKIRNRTQPAPKVWWEDEELSQVALDAAIVAYNNVQPNIVATHEAPTVAAQAILSDGFRKEKAACANTRTSIALQSMFTQHKPKIWVFGHYHRNWMQDIEGCKFICLDELCTLELQPQFLTKEKK